MTSYMMDLEKGMERLIRREGLDDLDSLLTPREWDEVPLVSQWSQLKFLEGMSIEEKSEVLVVAATRYLGRILEYVAEKERTDVVVLVSVMNWDMWKSTEPDPLDPNFWISTHPERDLVRFRLRHGSSQEARVVAGWLKKARLLPEYVVLDSSEPWLDPVLQRVYVARTDDPRVAPYILNGEA